MTRQEAQISTFQKLYGKKADYAIYDGLDLKITKLYGFFPPLYTGVIINESNNAETDSRE